ncbi:TPA: MdtL family multidrug efflux MFS transporter [Vibrio parahaemolyticus]|uniref:MFS transporter n=1 Tax=Vibrio parahaemolyticus TaxID=670 RepID=UPI0006A651C4|nr:MFS transporter [Vibrio parahaemolyticus]KOE74771.1 multidrug transporter [Vibrio parahaemolyticus]HAS6491338.1 MdtL family multidrug efflux MFS transporter [Vibrio parahaemolyticus]HAS6507103.1 MdtL family multidrug efflux MFS transporter [Vibrio parahaemolyticus]HAS6511790.1 MdtL family multidrug efflux MFS transporter [Vibrio parahaemolyticus]HAS6521791.1 MdtL family multidrug efflux MFS transporter [Vibrio parahaemolyticus]
MEQTNLSRYLMCSFAFVLLYPTAIDLYLVALPQIASDLSASESQLHIAFSIYLAGLASTMIFVGRAADYFGRKPVAMCGAVIFALASMFAGSAETSDSFLIMRFFQGVGAACCYVVAFAILRDTLDEQKRAKVLSMLNGIICSIPVLAPVVGNLIMIKFPWPVLFTAMAMMGITIGLIACFVLKETLPKKTKRPLLDVSEDTNESLYNHFFISRVVYTSLGVAAILSYVNTSPMIVMDSIGFTRAEYSIAMALLAMVGMTTSFSVPFALSYFKQTTLMFTAQITTLLSAIVILAAHLNGDSSTLYMVGFTLISMGFSMGFGVAMSQALSQFSRKAGLASSMLGIGQVSWSALYIWLMATLGVSAVMMLIITLVASGVIGLSIILLFPNHNVSEPHKEISCPT